MCLNVFWSIVWMSCIIEVGLNHQKSALAWSSRGLEEEVVDSASIKRGQAQSGVGCGLLCILEV